ncbi:ribosomal protein S18-alanine N-acetyltransferase [Sulfurimonas sp.]|uniref:ribosomal protein S18-alanine N-acetyltransferase n=1 Tax=Sulfurimonas sp. TaxID=2022749 RepID=UPI003566BF4C
MIIRKAQSKDASNLFTLEQELFNLADYPLSKASFTYHIRNNMLYIAESNGIILGYILVLIKRRNAKLYSIGVAQEHRGKKISIKLFNVILNSLEMMEFKELFLEVRVSNRVAISLYEQLGFSVLKSLKDFYRDGCDAYLMGINLKPVNLILN